ncbi:MAG: hypothetical protein ACRDLS_04725 [Solirubrobacteraceae bacterium]
MKTRAPSPALVISIIALVVACSATAYAATIITSSSQIKRGVVTGSDIKNRTVKGGDIGKSTIQTTNLSKSALKRIDGGAGGGGAESAVEVTRKSGPENQPGNQNIKVVEMTLPKGAYVITAKVTQQAFPTTGLLQLNVSVALGHCKLDAAGDVDDSLEFVAANQRSTSGQHYMQMTRTLADNSVIQIICDAGITWRASNASIIAMKFGSVNKTNVPDTP